MMTRKSFRHRSSSCPGSTAGFTLLELMFAAGVLALALSLLFGSLVSISIIGRISEARTQANTQLAGVLEEIRELPLPLLMSYTPPEVDSPGVRQAITLAYYNANGEEVALPLAPNSPTPPNLPNPLQVKGTFIWADNQERAYSVAAVTEHGR